MNPVTRSFFEETNRGFDEITKKAEETQDRIRTDFGTTNDELIQNCSATNSQISQDADMTQGAVKQSYSTAQSEIGSSAAGAQATLLSNWVTTGDSMKTRAGEDLDTVFLNSQQISEDAQGELDKIPDYISGDYATLFSDAWVNCIKGIDFATVFDWLKGRLDDALNFFNWGKEETTIPDSVTGETRQLSIFGINPNHFASGGLAFGETLAIVGDNPNARIDPEVIAPLSKLEGMLSAEAAAFPAPSQEDSFNRLAASAA